MPEELWTIERVDQLLESLRSFGGDTTHCEVKAAHHQYPQSIDATLCAFANTPGGGTIICGVQEKKDNQLFVPVGVYNTENLQSTIADKLRTQLSVPHDALFTHLDYHGVPLLIIDIAQLPAYQLPVSLGGRYYKRVGDGDYPMSNDEIQMMIAQRVPVDYDRQPIESASVNDLNASLLERFITRLQQEKPIHRGIDEAQVLERKNVMVSGHPSLAGIYALGAYPQQFVPTLKITGVVRGDEHVRNGDKLDTEGPLPHLMEEALAWLHRNLRHGVHEREDGHLINSYEIPPVALRELVANALVHRSLSPVSFHKEVTIHILPDRVIISNPGGLYNASVQEMSHAGVKYHVNTTLYELCKWISLPDGERIIEGEGLGIYRAQQAMSQAGLEPIHFVDSGFEFKAIIRRPSPDMALNAQQSDTSLHTATTPSIVSLPSASSGTLTANAQKLVDIVRAHGAPLSFSQLVEFSGLSVSQVRYALNQAVAASAISRQGGQGKRNTVYSAR